MDLFLGIDLGTTYFKAGLFDENGKLQGFGRQFVKKGTDDNIKCELSIQSFWSTLSSAIAQAISAAQADRRNIRAVSYSSQANTFLLLDKHNKPLTPLILWTDKRAGDLSQGLTKDLSGKDWPARTGLESEVSAQLCISKLFWFRTHEPSLCQRIGSVMTMSDYLTASLTGQRVADCSTASLLGILDIEKCQWSDEALQFSGLDTTYLSNLYRIGTPAGKLTQAGAGLVGLEPGTPFCVGGLDHHIAAVGAGVHRNNTVSESTGTVVAGVRYTRHYRPAPSVYIAPGLAEKEYFQMAFDENGAGSLEWYHRKYAPEHTIAELLDRASQIDFGSEGLIARPCAERYNDLEGFENIKPFHQHAHFVRAILESTACSLDNVVKKLTDVVKEESIIATGGGAMSKLWIEIKANMLGRKFIIPEYSESACLGAAMLAATSVHRFDSLGQASEKWTRVKEIISPNPEYYMQYSRWFEQKA